MALGIFSAVASNIGTNTQKYGFMQEASKVRPRAAAARPWPGIKLPPPFFRESDHVEPVTAAVRSRDPVAALSWPSQEVVRRRHYVQQPLWWVGFVLVVLGAIGDLFSFSLAPQSLVAPTGSFTLGEKRRVLVPLGAGSLREASRPIGCQ